MTDAAVHEFFLAAAGVAGALILLRIGKAQAKSQNPISERHRIPEKIHPGQLG
jgi:hypothetical protein